MRQTPKIFKNHVVNIKEMEPVPINRYIPEKEMQNLQ